VLETDFNHIVIQYQDRVYNTCLGFLKNAEDAEDVAQEVFMQVYKSFDHFLVKSEIGTWIYRIAVNKCLEQLRKGKSQKRQGLHSDIADLNIGTEGFYHPGVLLENKERAAILFAAIGLLPENQQTAFTLHKVEGLSYEEIGKIMDKSISSVESLMHRAKSNLQEQLKTYYATNQD
jgi:RNA polymerase sigma factor (sigma-70 family)